MDLAYLRAHPRQLPMFLTHQRIRETPVGGGSICLARRLTLSDGSSVFVKSMTDGVPVPPQFFAAEAAGLRWLRSARAVAVPEVIAALPELLALEWVETGAPSRPAAERFGRELAWLHGAGAGSFGASWRGYVGSLAQDNAPLGPAEGAAEDTSGWAEWFAQRRLRPHLRTSADRGALSPADVRLVEAVIDAIAANAPPDEPPSRLHGDLWHGNLLWGADGRVWLVDPSAHGGHRETDLAQLALFGGAPYLDQILAAYDEATPLASGWRERVPLHQLHLLLVHTALFGRAYREAVLSAARAAPRS